MAEKKRRKNQKKIEDSLKYSILDGTFYSAMVGCGESFFGAFAVFLRATSFELGMLASLPQALSSSAQLLTNKLMTIFKSRKKVIITLAILQTLMLIPIMMTFMFGRYKITSLIFFVCLYWVFNMMINPIWNSWMGDLVDEDHRGEYFGKRNKINGISLFISFIAGGFVLQKFFEYNSMVYVGFVVLFTSAFFLRILSIYFLARKFEPEFIIEKKSYFSFLQFVKHAGKNNFGHFVIFMGFTTFAVNVAAPFFAPYLLNSLNFSYWTFTLIVATPMVAKYFCMPLWGKASDRFGSIKVLSLTSYIMPIVPLLWLFSKNIYYLFLIQVYSGFVWAGIELSAFKFIHDTTSIQKRALCVAYYNVINGIATLAGAFFGYLILRVNYFFWSDFLLAFVVSFILRAVFVLVFIPSIYEVRKVEPISKHDLLMNIVKSGTTQGMMHSPIIFKWFRRK
ncbi:MAG: MFS transporter [Nanoarchaeota archaeon]|nr:MFS transporter [Nanoarchaeota archaeon]